MQKDLITEEGKNTSDKKESLAARYALFPIRDEESFRFYKSQQVNLWVADELDFAEDCKDYQELPSAQRKIIDAVLAFFLVGDGLIIENLAERFLRECTTTEEKGFFIIQQYIEFVHAETYGMALYTLVDTDKAMTAILQDVEEAGYIKAKAQFMEKYTKADLPKSDRFVAFACAEGIFFMALFGFVFWFRAKNKLKNFIAANEKISQDESLHCMRAVSLFHKEVGEHNKDAALQARVLTIIKEAVEIEYLFIKHVLPAAIEDLNEKDMRTLVECIADSLLQHFGCVKHYGSACPYNWAHDALADQKSNFYERRIVKYNISSLNDAMAKASRRTSSKKEDPILNPTSINF